MKTSRHPKIGSAQVAPPMKSATKLQRLIELLSREGGAELKDLMAATGWQAHSVRGALAGSLKKKGLIIESANTNGASG